MYNIYMAFRTRDNQNTYMSKCRILVVQDVTESSEVYNNDNFLRSAYIYHTNIHMHPLMELVNVLESTLKHNICRTVRKTCIYDMYNHKLWCLALQIWKENIARCNIYTTAYISISLFRQVFRHVYWKHKKNVFTLEKLIRLVKSDNFFKWFSGVLRWP